MKHRILIPALLLVLFISLGCSGGGSPIDPIQERVQFHQTGDSASQHSLMGLYSFVCDPDLGTVDVIPLRHPEVHINVLKFLEPPPLLYLTLESFPQFNGNILDVDIGLRNPFLDNDKYTGFDVCGIVFTPGSYSGYNDPDVVMAGEGDTRLLNADGFTRWWNPAEFPHGDTVFNYKDGLLGTPALQADFNCSVNGYKYFADGLPKKAPVTDIDVTKRGMSRGGQKNIRHYKMDLSGGGVFNYAVDACWTYPVGSAPYIAPDDFPPAANRPEAYYVSVTEVENTLYYDHGAGHSGGELRL